MLKKVSAQVLRQARRAYSTDSVLGGSTSISSEEDKNNVKAYPILSGERGVNKVILIGRVGRDADVRGTDENPVTLFSLATSVSVKRTDGTYEQLTDWHRIAVFRPGLKDLAAATIKKGDKVYVSGQIRYSDYSPTQGAPVRVANIIADDLQVIQKKELPGLKNPPTHD